MHFPIKIVSAFIITAFLPSVGMGADCPDFTGSYIAQGEDGQSEKSLKQEGCKSIEMNNAWNYLDKPSQSHITLPLNGSFHPAENWLDSRQTLFLSATLNEGKLIIQSKQRGIVYLTNTTQLVM